MMRSIAIRYCDAVRAGPDLKRDGLFAADGFPMAATVLLDGGHPREVDGPIPDIRC
jgi:hypothetical protein